jgi:serine/threonine protein kinase
MIHDGHPITIAQTTDGFQSQQRDVTGTRLEVKSKLGEGSYAVVYLVEEVAADDGQIHVGPRDEEGLMAGKRGGRAIAGYGDAEGRKGDDGGEADATFVDTTIAGTLVQDAETGEVNYNNGDLSSTLRANRGPRQSLASRAAEEEEAEQRQEAAEAEARGGYWDSQAHPGIDEPHEGRLFALKCLCKRDLSPEMLELQRLEATIHQSIPPHKNIITLYRTYETPEWLFLVLEYCPGQDLYYWLEQAHDVDGESEEAAQAIVRAHQSTVLTCNTDYRDEGGDGTISPDGTPPSPSLLASTSNEGLLSRKRLRLISKMFRQTCEAVQFCHDRGIA